tara:strand:- start:3762 stop:4070 length:309 start_codon:yes stop_codon:yes gene_type:complete
MQNVVYFASVAVLVYLIVAAARNMWPFFSSSLGVTQSIAGLGNLSRQLGKQLGDYPAFPKNLSSGLGTVSHGLGDYASPTFPQNLSSGLGTVSDELGSSVQK